MTEDLSNGWNDVAEEFMALRGQAGAELVRAWAGTLQQGAAVLDVGAGSGEPVARVLLEEGAALYAVEPAPRLARPFRDRYPGVPVDEQPAETSAFFGRTFDGVVAIGLLFLLPEETQLFLLRKMAGALEPGGNFLFSAPKEIAEWRDLQTERRSVSLGAEAYRQAVRAAGLTLVGEPRDEGGNHYWHAVRPRDA